jgi:quinol monooxygenase YgiN
MSRPARFGVVMIIYAGTLTVDAEQRDRFIALRSEQIARARKKPGVLEYSISADPLEPGVVQIFECYQDESSLAAHEQAHHRNQDVPVRSMSIFRYEPSGRSQLTLRAAEAGSG